MDIVSTFEERWRKKHPDDPYLPPYLGGPIDEIFLSFYNNNGEFPKFIAPKCVPVSPVQSPPRKRVLNMNYYAAREALTPVNESSISSTSFVDDLDEVVHTNEWLRVKKIPENLFLPIYNFFSGLGKIDSMRSYEGTTLYILYNSPAITRLAISCHNKLIICDDIYIYLHLTTVTKEYIMRMDQEQKIAAQIRAEQIKLALNIEAEKKKAEKILLDEAEAEKLKEEKDKKDKEKKEKEKKEKEAAEDLETELMIENEFANRYQLGYDYDWNTLPFLRWQYSLRWWPIVKKICKSPWNIVKRLLKR